MYKRSISTLVFTVFCLILAGTLLSGCTSTKTQADKPQTNTENPPASSSENPPSESASKPVKLTLYFPNSDATGLVATERTVEVKNEEVIQAIFRELAVPPAGLEKPLPAGTTLLSAAVNGDGLATIDLSTEFQKNFGGGSAGEQMTMYSIVNTLTSLPNINSVQFLLNGAKHDGILGHLDTLDPLERNESLIVAP